MHSAVLGHCKGEKKLADRGLPLPGFLSIKYDNTCREGKNQIVAKWMPWIQHRRVFRQVQDGAGDPRHSHDSQGQRFSVICAIFACTQVLQAPLGFVNLIRKTLLPVGGRKVFADI